MTPEGRVKDKIKKVLKSFGEDLYYEMPVPTGFGKSGLDFECVYRGFAFAIEAKAPGGKPSPTQEVTIERKRRAGCRVFVIDGPAGLLELRCWLTDTMEGFHADTLEI